MLLRRANRSSIPFTSGRIGLRMNLIIPHLFLGVYHALMKDEKEGWFGQRESSSFSCQSYRELCVFTSF